MTGPPQGAQTERAGEDEVHRTAGEGAIIGLTGRVPGGDGDRPEISEARASYLAQN
jgi:hypothetical protein